MQHPARHECTCWRCRPRRPTASRRCRASRQRCCSPYRQTRRSGALFQRRQALRGRSIVLSRSHGARDRAMRRRMMRAPRRASVAIFRRPTHASSHGRRRHGTWPSRPHARHTVRSTRRASCRVAVPRPRRTRCPPSRTRPVRWTHSPDHCQALPRRGCRVEPSRVAP